MANKLDIFIINADTLILTVIKGMFSEHSSLIWYIPIPHFWGAISVFSWQTLSRTAFPFNTILKPSALQFVCFRQAALDDVSFEKNPSGHLLHIVSLSGVPVETGKQCVQLHITSTVEKKIQEYKNKRKRFSRNCHASAFHISDLWRNHIQKKTILWFLKTKKIP